MRAPGLVSASKMLNGWLLFKLACVTGLAAAVILHGNALVVAIALHSVCDFVLQTDGMARAKARGSIGALVLHSIIAGGLPGFVAGGLAGAVVGIVSHLAIDATNKFGLRWPLAIIVDQACHVAVLVAIYGCVKWI